MGGNGKRYYMQYSVNEKVAMEVAAGAALYPLIMEGLQNLLAGQDSR